MGKKAKGSFRKDKFYFLAKEAGFRARSAFKLIQLNRRFNFLGSSKVLVDLCAAPGGWMQVAAKEMPVGSLIVGVDLVSIAPIPNCKSIVADITSEKCRQLLRAALLGNKADVVLHDGAPNVGTAWTIDEYSQASLCLKAFSLATEFLRKGGWFITKVFRSRDYEPLKWAVSQFFSKVRVLKPEASRQESAEIFLVGQNYLDPSAIDPKFLDPRHVFGETEVKKSRETVVSTLLKLTNKKRKAEGYEDDKLYKETLLSEFLKTDDPLKCLAKSNKIVIDRRELMSHPLAPPYIEEALSDIQVLGKADIRMLLAWRKKIVNALETVNEAPPTNVEEKTTVETDSVDEEGEVQREVERLLKEEQKTTKKRFRAIRKAKRKLAERIVLKMEHPGDIIEHNNASELFSLTSIGGRDLDSVEKVENELIEKTGYSAADLLVLREEQDAKREVHRKRDDDFRRAVEGGEYLRFERGAEHEIDVGALESKRPITDYGQEDIFLSSNDSDDTDDNGEWDDADEYKDMDFGRDNSESDREQSLSPESFEESESEDQYSKALAANTHRKEHSSLLTDLDPADEETKKKMKIDAWCNSAELKKLVDVYESDDDEDEVGDSIAAGTRKRVTFADAPVGEKRKRKTDDPKSQLPPDPSPHGSKSMTSSGLKKKDKLRRLRRPLTAEERALATRLIQSAKSRRDLLEWNFHRYRFFEEESNLPEWFVTDEKKHMRKAPPLEETDRQTNRPIQGKTLKKAEEAKLRKKMRMSKRLARVRKRAENLPDDLTEKEAWSKIKTMYKNAGLLKKKRRPISYVVNTKAGARTKRQPVPRGAKIKLVDRRMKSDLRGQFKAAARREGRGGKTRRGRRP